MNTAPPPIAIVGMAGIYPGAPTVARLWKNILDSVDAVTDAPASWNAARFHDPSADGRDNTHTYCQRGGFIEAFAEFDPLEFGIMPGSVDGSDPGHFLCLRVTGEALTDAGVPARPLNRERTAVIIGHGSYPHRGMLSSIGHGMAEAFCALLHDTVPDLPPEALQRTLAALKSRLPPSTPDTCPGLISNVLSGRIANRFDLMGPNYLVDAACASSMVALDAGMRELHAGRCDAALVGGAQENTHAGIFTVFSMLGALSRRGRLRPFDKNADGTLLGEGIGMMVIKRLADAERDGNRIYALIRGVGLSSDGKAQAFLVPRLEGEVAALRRAYEQTGIDPATVDLVEAHGTGTTVGDRTEVKAMTQVFGARDDRLPRCAVGSVKSMISHTLPAAGMAGLFKSALALYHKVLPPTLCDEPNPELGFDQSALYLNTRTRPWIHGKSHPRRAGVNAFGFGGVNSHVILEEYTPPGDPGESLMREWACEVIALRADSREGVRERARAVREALRTQPERPLREVADELNSGDDRHGRRCLALVASDLADLGAKLDEAAASLRDGARPRLHDPRGIYYTDTPLTGEGRVAFLLPGEGSQYAGMLAGLCLHFDEVRGWFDRTDRVFVERGRRPLPSQVVFPPPHLLDAERRHIENALWDMAYALPLVTAADGAMVHLLLLLGIRPDAVAGHSTAQDLALPMAALADRLTPENITRTTLLEDRVLADDIAALVPRAQLMSVGASSPERVAALARESRGTLYVAMDNCPNQVVLCGAPEAIETARAALGAEGAVCQFLPFDRAYHTPLYRPVCDRIEQTAGTYEDLVPRLPAYSCTTGKRFPDAPAALRRIMIDQWAEPIRFREMIETMHADGVRVFVEAGPRGNLTGFVSDTLGPRAHAAIPCNVAQRGDLEQLHHALAQMAAHGVPMDLDVLYARRRPDPGAATAPRPARPRLKLKTEIPTLGLDAPDRDALRAALQRALGAPASAPPSDLHALRADDPLLQTHLRTMGQLAAVHEEVMQAALRRQGQAR